MSNNPTVRCMTVNDDGAEQEGKKEHKLKPSMVKTRYHAVTTGPLKGTCVIQNDPKLCDTYLKST